MLGTKAAVKRLFGLTTVAQNPRSRQYAKKRQAKHKKEVVVVDKLGVSLIQDSLYNKGTGWPQTERDRLGLRGLIPPHATDLQTQIQRIMNRLEKIEDPLEKYLFLVSLQDRNETLFYKIVIDNMPMMAPLIYTPTVGQACQQFSYIYRRPRGMYFSAQDKGQMAAMVFNWPEPDVDVIVVTDGSRILGLGDLGAQGMGISIGKLSLYVAAGGIHPQKVLPVCVDVGTNNPQLLNDPMYIGLHQPRITGDEYFELLDEFLSAIYLRWPSVLVQFEDFANDKALPLLEKYRYKYLCFNDDIQGTGSVTLSGIMSALRARGGSKDDLPNERVVVVGAGSAGLGVTNSLAWTMVSELGVRAEEAFKQFYLVDGNGLLGEGRSPNAAQMRYIRSDLPDGMPLLDVVREVKPTILLGLTGIGGLFTEEVIREMYKHTKRPIVFPLSNPTSCAECTAEQAYTWTEGNAIFASGSPFDPFVYNGKTLFPSQGNNMYIFPAVGLACVLIKAKRVSYRMLNRAGLALTNSMTMEEINSGRLFPHLDRIREVTIEVASAVARAAFTEGLAGIKEPSDLEKFISENMFWPEYASVVYSPHTKHNNVS